MKQDLAQEAGSGQQGLEPSHSWSSLATELPQGSV